IRELAHRLDVCLLEIDLLDGCRLCSRRSAVRCFCSPSLHNCWRRRAPKLGLELHSIPVPGIVAGGNHHSTCRALLFYGQRDGGRRRVVVRELYWDTCIRDDFCHQAGKSRRPEARVITDYYALTGVFVLEHVRSDRTRHSAYVLKGVIIGDDAAPTVGTELDLGHKSFELGASSFELRASRFKYCRHSLMRVRRLTRRCLIVEAIRPRG